MSLKRPVTIAQARRWPAAAARRESFCARMGGMREQLTSERVARDPRSRINRALAAWDCDVPELLQAKHTTKGIRPMKITRNMVGAEAKKKAAPRKNPTDMTVAQTILRQLGGNRLIAMTGARNFFAFPLGLGFELPRNPSGVNQVTITYNPRSDLYAMSFLKTKRSGLDSVTVAKFDDVYADQMRAIFTRVTGLETSLGTMGRPSNPARKPAARRKNPAREKLARIMVTDDKTGEKRVQTVPYDFAIKAYIGPVQHDFFVRSEGATLVVSEKSTGLRVGAVPYMKRYATMNDREAAKGFLAETVQRVGPEKFRAAIAKAPKIA